ncbi:hypothetical protein CXG81DRAFT_25008 [Caulochytrium protostelioides]|nr:hypothetical protein CXG81DRAFT_25008 [Caulochytrium protostelioides]|eukprot:RKP02314.1 hypothetical protein CXG81DRAFT_25008 [Caulochytrium protostelioides]
MTEFVIEQVATTPFEGQKPGTSGLRKRTTVFQQKHYTANFVQALLDSIPEGAKDAHLVVGGDGRYYSDEAIQIIARLAAANGVRKLTVAHRGILSTPAGSHLIRKLKATGGILLTASHNPGGPDNDFGIKYNGANGGPAPEAVTDAIYRRTTQLTHYAQADLPPIDITTLGTTAFGGGCFEVEVVDGVAAYVELMKSVYDLEAIKQFLRSRPDFTVLFDAMGGVTGPYFRALFVQELGFPADCCMNAEPSPDFGGHHPDPNLTYAKDLVARVEAENVAFAAASDGDGDRNMIIGKGCFVNPSDSIAVLAAYAPTMPYFARSGVKGVARSMPTSGALDRVAKKHGWPFHETPTGWKFFGNLMDAGQCSLCGEESFGTGSDHIREKDGVWAVLGWLSILAAAQQKAGPEVKVGLKTILDRHYAEYGRNYFSRYDYEEVDGEQAAAMMARLRAMVAPEGRSTTLADQSPFAPYTLKDCDDFHYVDPIDGSVAEKQGVRFLFADGSRIIFRLSGTGSQGATIRVYVEAYEATRVDLEPQTALKDLIQVALRVSQLQEFTGRKVPTVIT